MENPFKSSAVTARLWHPAGSQIYLCLTLQIHTRRSHGLKLTLAFHLKQKYKSGVEIQVKHIRYTPILKSIHIKKDSMTGNVSIVAHGRGYIQNVLHSPSTPSRIGNHLKAMSFPSVILYVTRSLIKLQFRNEAETGCADKQQFNLAQHGTTALGESLHNNTLHNFKIRIFTATDSIFSAHDTHLSIASCC